MSTHRRAIPDEEISELRSAVGRRFSCRSHAVKSGPARRARTTARRARSTSIVRTTSATPSLRRRAAPSRASGTRATRATAAGSRSRIRRWLAHALRAPLGAARPRRPERLARADDRSARQHRWLDRSAPALRRAAQRRRGERNVRRQDRALLRHAQLHEPEQVRRRRWWRWRCRRSREYRGRAADDSLGGELECVGGRLGRRRRARHDHLPEARRVESTARTAARRCGTRSAAATSPMRTSRRAPMVRSRRPVPNDSDRRCQRARSHSHRCTRRDRHQRRRCIGTSSADHR